MATAPGSRVGPGEIHAATVAGGTGEACRARDPKFECDAASNVMVNRRGMLWQDESYDHSIRGDQESARAVQYILDNPRKAGLSAGRWVYVRRK